MSSKRIQRIKEKIIDALEDKKPLELVSAFYSLAIVSVGINITLKSLDEIK